MIKRFVITCILAWLCISPAIAQPFDYLEDFINKPEPQNYFYEELPEVTPFYDTSKYRNGAIINSYIQHYTETLWFTPGNCTIYVAHMRRDLFPAKWKNKFFWNAKHRLEQADKQWIPVGKKPKPGAIAVFAPRKWATGEWHVAYVEEVGDNGLIVISDMNARGKFVVTTRVISAQLPEAYIY